MADVTVIIPTIGTDLLKRAIQSVRAQSFPCSIAVVADGPAYAERVRKVHPEAIVLPWNVGGGGVGEAPHDRLLGHPMYAAMPFLCKTKYVAFLDEDNWYDPRHIEALVTTCERESLPWAFSLRKVWVDGQFLCIDLCESLGNLCKCFDRDEYLVDTSCFLVRRDVAMSIGGTWMHPHADRPVTRYLMETFPKTRWSGLASLNYQFQVQNSRGQVAQYFLYGNQVMLSRGDVQKAEDGPAHVVHEAVEGPYDGFQLVAGKGHDHAYASAGETHFSGVPEARSEKRMKEAVPLLHAHDRSERHYQAHVEQLEQNAVHSVEAFAEQGHALFVGEAERGGPLRDAA